MEHRSDFAGIVLDTVPDPVLLLDADDHICYANLAAQDFFGRSENFLGRLPIDGLVHADSPLHGVIAHVRTGGYPIAEYGIDIHLTPELSERVDVKAAPVAELSRHVLVMLRQQTVAQKIDRQLRHLGAARSVSGMSSVLAHEIKNPLSGIRGAAQLIEQNVGVEDRQLARLIREEADRIRNLVDRMEAFAEPGTFERSAVNIHEVLDHARRVIEAGFNRKVRITEKFDPSLPEVVGARDQLVQVFLNLIKNAGEACSDSGGEITLTTAYSHGVRLKLPGSETRIELPIEICVIDNGSGIPPELEQHVFEPFVTSKPSGSGLGLALVAKLVGDHGGLVECDSVAGQTVFRVLLPAALKHEES